MSIRRVRFGRVLLALLLLGSSEVACTTARQPATPAASDTPVKVVILSRHGVRAPLPPLDELKTWTTSPWPTWYCPPPDGKICDLGQLTPQGRFLAGQMGTYYRNYLSKLLPEPCPAPDQVFFWADLDERTKSTGLALLGGFRPACDITKYFHTTSKATDTIFHPVSSTGACRLNPDRAENEIRLRVGGDLSKPFDAEALAIAQRTLECCVCDTIEMPCGRTGICSLTDIPSCLVPHPSQAPTKVELGGGLRIAETFSELLLLEYANGFPLTDVGWERINIKEGELTRVFRLHAAGFDLEQRTPYIATLQGSRLLNKIRLALQGKTDNEEGTAPPNAKFVAYVGHDTNISNVAAMLGLSWQLLGYQKDQTPPAGALIFELHRLLGNDFVTVSYAAQALDDMRNRSGSIPLRTPPLPIPGCDNAQLCPLDKFARLVKDAREKDQPGCWQ